jgi:hypothetical protein
MIRLYPMASRRYRNKQAIDRGIGALRELGHLEPVDEPVVALARTTADALDVMDPAEQGTAMAAMVRAHLAVLTMLRGSNNGGSGDDLSNWLTSLSSQVGDAPLGDS